MPDLAARPDAADTAPFAGAPRASEPPVALDTPCRACRLSTLCLPCGLPGLAPDQGGDLVFGQRRVKAGQRVYGQGDPFAKIHAVRAGALKSTLTLANGREQICGFHLEGEVFALDGMASGLHASTTTALEDSQVCTIGYAPLIDQIAHDPERKRRLSALLSAEISRTQRQMLLLGHASAQERLAAFLLDMSQRFKAHGHSARDFNLRMTRAEIGSFLGLTLETISRSFTSLRAEGLLQVDSRRVRFADLDAFRRRYDALLMVR